MVDFTDIFTKAFMHGNPKSIKIPSSCQYLFAFLGSASIKAASKMLMKLTSGVNFINVRAALMCTDPQKDTDNLTEFLCFWDLRA